MVGTPTNSHDTALHSASAGTGVDPKLVALARRQAEVSNLKAYLYQLIQTSGIRDLTKISTLMDAVNGNLDGFLSGTVSPRQAQANILTEIKGALTQEQAQQADKALEELSIAEDFAQIQLSEAARQRIANYCVVVTSQNIDQFIDSFRDEHQPVAVQKFTHQAQKRIFTDTEAGQKAVADHNEMAISHPKALKQAKMEIEQARAATEKLLKKFKTGGIHEQLELIQQDHLFEQPKIREVLGELYSGKAVAEGTLKTLVHDAISHRVHEHLHYTKEAQVGLKGAPQAIQDVSANMTQEERAWRMERLCKDPNARRHADQCVDGICHGKVPPSMEDKKDAAVQMEMKATGPLLELNAVDQIFHQIEKDIPLGIESAKSNANIKNISGLVTESVGQALITKSKGFAYASLEKRTEYAMQVLKKSDALAGVQWTEANERELHKVATEYIAGIDDGTFQLKKVDLKQSLVSGLGTIYNGDQKGMQDYANLVQETMNNMGASHIVSGSIHAVLVGVGTVAIKVDGFLKENGMEKTREVLHGTLETMGGVVSKGVLLGADIHQSVAKKYNDLKVGYHKEDDIQAVLDKGQMHKSWVPILDKDHNGKASMDEVMGLLKNANVSLGDYDKNHDGHTSAAELGKALQAALKIERGKASSDYAVHVKTGSHVAPSATPAASMPTRQPSKAH